MSLRKQGTNSFFFIVFQMLFSFPVLAIDLENDRFVSIVAGIKNSVVGVGVHAPLATVSQQLHGTGFVVGDGHFIVTNNHVVDKELEEGIKSERVVFVPNGLKVEIVKIESIFRDEAHDLAILKIAKALTPSKLIDPNVVVADGKSIGITGFPIGAVLGLFPATHKGSVAAFTPNITPVQNSTQLSEQFVIRVNNPYMVYQLDIVAYPGNSGSPVYLSNSGDVFAVINKVFVNGTREAALSMPSGITYAIPIKHVYQLAEKHGISLFKSD